MIPQGHSLIRDSSDLDQMLHHQLPYAPMPSIPNYPMDRPLASSTARWKPNIEVAPNCPRCASTNTKFCYYNNYSLSQPRYFCKACRRYWTKGGSLRNVPVGGGCRKNRRGRNASRHSHHTDHRLSVSNNASSDDGDSSNSAAGEANGSRDIDMAVVFAKYLNQPREDLFESEGYNSNNNNNGSSSSNNNLSSSLTTTPESGETENDAVGLLGGAHLEGFGGEELMSLSGVELDGFDHDVVWSQHHHDAARDAIAASWQPPPLMQMDDYSVAAPPAFNAEEDGGELLLPIGSSCVDLMSDGWGAANWSSFDLSTVEVFSSIP